MTDYLMLLLGHALVWALGVALVLALPGRTRDPDANLERRGDSAWILATGWFAGAFALTLLMRGLSAIGVPFGRASIGLPLLALTVVLGAVGWHRHRRAATSATSIHELGQHLRATVLGTEFPRWQRVLWWALLAWIAFRFGLLLAEVSVRPLYAWDTWMQWATKARVWFELGQLAPFAPMDAWLKGNGAFYFDAAPHAPATVPLWQVWSAVLIGRWDDALTNFAWWTAAVALALATYGYLRATGAGRGTALVGAWFVTSLPMLDVHVALAGYADLPIAAYLTLACLAGMRWSRERGAREFVLFVLFLVALPTIKNPGKAWALLLLPGVVAAWWPLWGKRMVMLLIGLVALALLVIAQTNPVIPAFPVQFNAAFPWNAIVDAYFALGNWHLLWFGVIAIALIQARWLLGEEIAPLTLTVAGGILFLLFGFAFSSTVPWIEDQSPINRATLQLAPLLVIWMVRVFDDWSRRATAAAPQAEQATTTSTA